MKMLSSGCSTSAQMCVIAILAALTAAPAVADKAPIIQNNGAQVFQAQMVEQVGASQRIDFSGKLRMLSQRVVASACYVQAGISIDQSRAVLDAAVAEFSQITNALEFGDPDLGIIGAEERRKTRAGITKLNELWAPVAAIATNVANGEGTAADITAMADQSGPVLEIAVRLVSQISGQYSNSAEILQSDAMVIDVAGRQRMLAQRMSKNTCLVASGINVDTARAELTAASEIFDSSLKALYFGMPEVGISGPPTSEIEANLSDLLGLWQDLQPLVNTALETGTLDQEQLGIMFTGANALTGGMNTVVGMYSDASKMGI